MGDRIVDATVGFGLAQRTRPFRRYRVAWEIDVWAASHRQAVRLARDAQVRPGTTATLFTAVRQGDPAKSTGCRTIYDTKRYPYA
jgi:hypothetical protein